MNEVTTRPRPTAPPVYRVGSAKVSGSAARPWGLDDVLDVIFFVVAAVAALWLAWVLLGSGWHLSPILVGNAVLFWATLAYLALPRLHQILTWLYVPDYFIGRTRTSDGLLGDPVNLAVLGDEDDLHEAMTAAGWVRADPITPGNAWRMVISSLLRRSYPTAPVSPLLLFGRAQDVAYQKEVAGNPSRRHHVRFWHTPADWVLPGGEQVDWLAAATYDRAVSLSVFTFQVTHKIDANIDLERDYVVDDVLWACPAARDEVLADFFTSYHSTNGGGDRVMTDGDLHVLDLADVVLEPSNSLDLVRARTADAEARRQRPVQLVLALVLIGVNVAWRAVDGLVGGLSGITSTAGAQLQEIEAVGGTLVQDPRTARILALVLGAGSAVVSAAILVLAVATWRGHPRGRIALMVVLAVKLSWDMTRMSAVGVRHASFSLVAASALGVLALLALSARDCHLWERARKAKRHEAHQTARRGSDGAAPATRPDAR